MIPAYLDFVLLFERSEGKYRAKLIQSPAGQTQIEFELPIVNEDLHDLASRNMEELQAFGSGLFQTVFRDEMRSCLGRSVDEAANKETNLCIHLRFTDVPELADLPWEYLYNPPPLSQFFALSAETPIVRYLDLPRSDKPLKVQLPLRVLVMIANPQNYDQFDANNHWTKIKEDMDELVQDKLVALDRLDTASLDALQQQLRWDKYHIFHFVGHGGFDKEAQDGVLVLEDETGQGHVVPGKDLGMLLKDDPSLKLAVLNTCQGARVPNRPLRWHSAKPDAARALGSYWHAVQDNRQSGHFL